MVDIDKRDMKVIQVFICHLSFVPNNFVSASLSQFDGCEQSEDFFSSHKHVRIVFIPEDFNNTVRSCEFLVDKVLHKRAMEADNFIFNAQFYSSDASRKHQF